MKKNLVFIMTDQQRADTLGMLLSPKGSKGSEEIMHGREITPHLNLLAEESTVFERAYNACPLCVPARTALATGQNPLKNGMMLNDLQGVYAKDNKTLHQMLSEDGYEVAHIGVNHISVKPPLKDSVDFSAWECDETYAEYAKSKGISTLRKEEDADFVDELCDKRYEKRKYSNAHVSLWDYELEDFKDVWFTDRALEYIKEDHQKPFALFLALWAPHPPLVVPEQYWNLYKDSELMMPENIDKISAGEPLLRRRGAAAGLAEFPPDYGWEEGMKAHLALTSLCDDQIGRILSALKEQGLDHNTVIVFTTDHGEQMGQHRMYQKMEMYEPAVRVPAIFHVPGVESRRFDVPVSHLDFVPTILDLLKIEDRRENLDGQSLSSSVIDGKEPETKDVFGLYCGNHSYGDQRRMIVRDPYKYVFDGVWKELYDLRKDPLEMNNLSGDSSYKKVMDEMHDSLKKWSLDHGDTHCFREEKRKNLLFVFADQWRRDAVGYSGKDPVYTPNMDAFAGESVYCTDAVSTFPLCSPHRASLLTGKHPLSTGVFTNCKTGLSMKLSDSERGIGQCLKEYGYDTGYIGKWHLDEPEQNHSTSPESGARRWDAYTPPGPGRHGFDFWYSYGAWDEHMAPHYWKNTPQKIKTHQWSPEHETDTALEYLEHHNQDNPFALFLSWNPPHSPYDQVPEKYLNLYEDKVPLKGNVDLKDIHQHTYEYLGYSREEMEQITKQYYAAVSGLDDQFGRLIQWLKEHNIYDDTLIILSADHGDMLGSHGLMAKHVWYEESIGIPLIAGGAGLEKGECKTVIGSPDIMPTVLGLLNVPLPSEVEGIDCSEDIRHRQTDNEKVCYLAACPGRDIFLKAFQEAGKDPRHYGWRGIRAGQYTYIVDVGYETEPVLKRYLYDLKEDPMQQKPFIMKKPSENPIGEQLEGKLLQWLNDQQDGFIHHILEE